jgi:dolichol kinase
VEKKPVVVVNLESPAITIRGLFIFSWILTILIPFPFINYFVEKDKMEKVLLPYQPILKSMADPVNFHGQRLQNAWLIAIGLIFAALLLRTLAHFLSAAVGLPQKKEPKTELSEKG